MYAARDRCAAAIDRLLRILRLRRAPAVSAATLAARQRHDAGARALLALFGLTETTLAFVDDSQTGRPRPYRAHPGCPPERSADHRRRRRRRKLARAARRENR